MQLNPSIVLAHVAPFLHGLLAHSLTSKRKNEAEFLNTRLLKIPHLTFNKTNVHIGYYQRFDELESKVGTIHSAVYISGSVFLTFFANVIYCIRTFLVIPSTVVRLKRPHFYTLLIDIVGFTFTPVRFVKS